MTPAQWKLFNEIIENIDHGTNLESAEQDLDNLLADKIEPVYTYYVLGALYLKSNRIGKALHFLELAYNKAPTEYHIVCNYATACQGAGFFEQALSLYNEAAAIPGKPYPYINYTNCLIKLGRFEQARDLAYKGIHEGDKSTELLHNLSHALLSLGDYADGFEFNETRLALADHPNKMHEIALPYWKGEKGQTVLVYEEQGLGDEIMFSSILPDLMRDCKVVFDCNPRLESLFKRSFPDISVHGHKPDEVVQFYKEASYKFDAKVSIGSLAKFYRKKESDFPKIPYLQANPDLVEKYRLKLAEMGSRPKIGISWYGGGIDRARLTARFNALSNWEEILKLPCDFISLQYNKEAGEKIKRFTERTGFIIHHWPETLGNFDETAALLTNLDLVISAPQTVIHLAGALGVPTWRLCSISSLWMHGPYGQNAPWYGSVENIWQENLGEWGPVMEKVKGKLEDYVNHR